jgi:hypothetical protein
MANIQQQLVKFNDSIRISYDEDSKLREKRDMLLTELRAALTKKFVSTGVSVPTFDIFNQGSYYMRTGIKPLVSEDHDIDVGIRFNFSKESHLPTKVKEWVFEALQTGARTVEYKRNCIRAQYHKAGEKSYHVDIAVYVHPSHNSWQTYLAKGYVGSKEEYKKWEIAEPEQLKTLFDTKFSDANDREQFRRIIRYLKKWKDVNFSASGNERPTGIALTACVIKWFSPNKSYYSPYNDLDALLKVVNYMISNYSIWSSRLTVNLPVQPQNNLFEKMSDNQMLTMKTKLTALRDALMAANNDASPVNALARLKTVFGHDFPTY